MTIADQAEKLTQCDDDLINELAGLSSLEYDRRRTEAADTLGCRAVTLDRLVKAAKADLEVSESQSLIENDEPWNDSVDGSELLRSIVEILRRHAVLPKGAETAIALWVLGSFSYDNFRVFPKLLLSSPEKRCGKSTLLEIIRSLSHRALMASNITPSAIFRCIDAWRPTLLIDEADTFLHGNDELRGIVNSGHTRSTAFVIRVVGDDHEPRQFSTWSPMVLAMIKLPPETILDRSITIPMRRKLPGESVTRLQVNFADQCRDIRSKCLRWANDNADKLKDTNPTLPESGNDRAIDNWASLLAIAELIGQRVANAAINSFHALQGSADTDDDGIGPSLLRDIRLIFDGQGKSYLKLHSEEIVNRLIEMEGRPWAEWRHGRPMTKHSLANLLRPFKVKSGDVRIGSVVRGGYHRSQFDDCFLRYLPDTPFQNATPLQPTAGMGYSDFPNATEKNSVAIQKPLEATDEETCSDVASKNPHTGENQNWGFI